MGQMTRRNFLKTGFAAAATVAATRGRVLGANADIRIGIIGFNGRGKDHIKGFHGLPGVRIVALCDVDSDVLGREAKAFEKIGQKVETYSDVRKLLENKDIDAISTATPNHWHSLIAIWACQAGKDVYVEKPVSHNVSEGRRVVEAARKYNRIVQAGCQSRSNVGMIEAVKYVQDGNLGKINLVRGLCYKHRPSIGKTEGEQPVPKSVDYDLWTGPAPLAPLHRKKFHYDWHWQWATGNGDLGNQGIHQMDIARWILGEKELSPRVLSIGGRFGYEDDGETANTQVVFHDYARAPLFFEVRGLPHNPTVETEKGADGKSKEKITMDDYKGASVGIIVHCEGGYMVLPSYNGGTVYDKDGKKVKSFSGGGNHFENFIDAVRSRKYSDLHAEILDGHLSSALCHTGNIAYRLGKSQTPDAIMESLKGNADATETFERMQKHLAANNVDLSKTPAREGAWLKMDPQTERFIDNDAANAMLTREYRKGFVVPESV